MEAAGSPTPYPGLRSFRRAEFDIFFGRDDHVSDMLGKLAENRFLCITGPSGCGKSSLARTGLFNALEAGFMSDRGSDWIFCDLHPETNPIGRLCHALAKAIVMGESGRGGPEPDADEAEQIGELEQLFLNHITTRSSNLTAALARVTSVAGRPIVILVDQFEEIFRYAQDDPHAASRFVDVLLKTAGAKGDVHVVITIRTDELEKCARYAGLTNAINHSQFLTPTLDRFQMQEAIEGPIAMFGASIDPELSIWMLNGLEEQLDKLPLMQHALRLLYQYARRKQPEGNIRIGLKDFFEVFDLGEQGQAYLTHGHDALRMSLSNRLDAIYDALEKQDQQIARDLFCALTMLESRGRDIRRPLRVGVAARTIGCDFEHLRRVIERFSKGSVAYLRIAGEEDGITADDTVDVAHECVLRLWRPLQEQWLVEENGSAENIRFLARLTRERGNTAELSWLDRLLGRGLMTGRTLTRYSHWWRRKAPNATWAERYLERVEWREGGEVLDAETVFERIADFVRQSKRWTATERILTWSIPAAIVAFVAVYSALNLRANTLEARNEALEARAEVSKAEAELLREQIEQAQRQRQISDVWQSVSLLSPGPLDEAPLETAEQAADALQNALDFNLKEDAIDMAREKLVDALSYVRELRRFDHGKGAEDQIFAAEFLPDQRYFVTLSEGLTLSVWDRLDNRAPVRTLELKPYLTHRSKPLGRSMAVAPDGTIAVGTRRGAALLVDGLMSDTQRVQELYPGPPVEEFDTMSALAFSQDGATLIGGAGTGHVHVWTRGEADDWRRAALFLARNLVARGQGVGLLPADGTERAGRQHVVWSIAMSPGDDFAAFGIGDGKVCLMTLDGIETRCSGQAHQRSVKALAFSPDGGQLVSGGADDVVRVWTLSAAEPPADAGPDQDGRLPELTLSGAVLWHTSEVWSADFSDDGRYLATAAQDGTARLFQTDDWRPLQVLRGHELAVRTARLDAQGREILTASLDQTARLWTPGISRLNDGDIAFVLPHAAQGNDVQSVTLGQDAMWLAATDGSKIWIRKRDSPRIELFDPDSFLPKGDTPFRIAAPQDAHLLVAAMRSPRILLWEPDAAGAWQMRAIEIEGADVAGSNRYRRLAVSRDGSRVAVNVTGNETVGHSILVCDTSAETCGSAPGHHVALVPFDPLIETDRNPEDDCNREAEPTALGFAKGGEEIIVGGTDCNVRVYSLRDQPAPQTHVMSKLVGNITGVDASDDGARVAASSTDWQGSVWSPANEDVRLLRGHTAPLSGIKMLPASGVAATASVDERIIIWNVETGRQVLEFPSIENPITTLDAKPYKTGAVIAIGTRTGEAMAFHYFGDNEEILDFARETFRSVLGHAKGAGVDGAGADGAGVDGPNANSRN